MYRVLGSPVANSFGGVYGGVIGHPTGTITIDHDGYPAEAPIPVRNGAFAAVRAWTGVPNARTGGHDSVPGGVTITFTDSTTGTVYRLRRNIDTGSATGSQTFMLDVDALPPVDAAPPTVTITAPAAGSTLSGTTTIAATAQDDVAVARVDFSVDGSPIGSDRVAPYGIAWDSRTSSLGGHTITATAVDTYGRSTAASRSFTIADLTAPTVSFTAPTVGATVGGPTTLAATATDDRSVARVEFSVDGRLIATVSSAPYSFVWNADTVTLGAHTVTARAVDPAGRSTSTSVTVTVADLTDPTVTLTSPLANSTIAVGTKVTVSATATDNRKVARVEFWVDGVLKLKDTTAPFSYVWTVPTPKGTKHTILARAVDGSGRTRDASTVITAG
jgi:hypothetical protein